MSCINHWIPRRPVPDAEAGDAEMPRATLIESKLPARQMRAKTCDVCHYVIPAKAGIQEGRSRDTGQFRLVTGLRPDGRGGFVVMPAEQAWMA